ncbi:sodium/potassium-transporting atpase subunit alpha [Holotrichia oblita]|uniref:Sodium/potassium-transporting atpase subunit alpha n=1 Tax=Holotrichia oblita TaxID=644536 RepID=A0ACB9ST49_HOLOL|nr:sodium/potassium-transporting atpase subunit alpha [Holotrichia oblita]
MKSIRSHNRRRSFDKHLNRRELSRFRLERFKRDVVTDIHKVTLDNLCFRLDTNVTTGLTKKRAQELLKKYGYNELTPSTKTPEFVKFMATLTGGFSLLLWVGASLCALSCFIEYFTRETIDTDNLTLGLVLVIIIILTGLFVYYQEHKSSKIMESFANMIPMMANVIREGEHLTVQARELVIGDLVTLKFGDRIPADVRVIKNSGLKVDNSALTGESEPVVRSTEFTSENFHESRNVALFSTNAVEGTATGIVVATGDDTVMGHIAGLTARLQPNKTPISVELKKFMHLVTIWACCIGTTFGILCAFMGYSWIESALFLIGIIVSNVPEGLLATVTVSLSVTAKKLAAKNCLIKNLPCVETLGSTSVICSDKTGTLTQNKMTVCHLWFNGSVISADVSTTQEDAKRYRTSDDFKVLMRAATLCNRAEFEAGQQEIPIMQRLVLGDASEAAILKFVELTQCHGSVAKYKRAHPKLIELPFNSTTKYQVSVHRNDEGCIVVMKGAPENIIERCSTIYMNMETQPLQATLRNMCDRACLELASKGERILGFADYQLNASYTRTFPFTLDPRPNFPTSGMRFLGFISLFDPPRPQVHEAVFKCRSAGIKIIMVTGDHPVTAKSIAEEVGIITKEVIELTYMEDLPPGRDDLALVITGSTLRDLTGSELEKILFHYKEIVFARTSPAQKLQIVEGCQKIGHIVAVTGDGVNDSPALKKADIGIAMGISGTEVSKQSADMVLLDDNFASLIIGVEEGRKIFDNLKKSIAYVLASNIPEVTPFLAFITFGIPLPLGVLAVLCIDVLTDMLPSISLAYEEPESDIMKRPPRNPNKDQLVTGKLYFFAYGHIGFIEAAAGFFVYFMIMAEYGFLPERLLGLRKEWDSMLINDLQDSYGMEWTYEERKILQYTCYTAFLIAVVISQWADAIICKTRRNSLITQGMKNWQLNLSIVIETAIACILAYCPENSYLKFYPVKLRWWLYAMPFGVAILIFDECRKWHIRRYPEGYWARETFY